MNKTITTIGRVLELLIALFIALFTIEFITKFKFSSVAEYHANEVLLICTLSTLLFCLIYSFSFFKQFLTKEGRNKKSKIVYLTSTLLIGLIQLFEMVYNSILMGSEEIRQKISYPYFASCMLTLFVLKIKYSKESKLNVTLKIILAIIVNIGISALWMMVSQ